MRFARICTLSIALAMGSLSVGCKEDPMVRARAAHAIERADEAESALKEVLATAPKDFEARRLMADIHRMRGDFAKTESALKELWAEKGFEKDGELPPEERAHRDKLEGQFNELYMKWSDSLDPANKPDEFEKVVRSGLEWDPKSPTLNRVLVDHLLSKAAALEKEGKKLEAAQAFEAVLQLRAMKAQRQDAKAKSESLRTEAFKDEVLARLEPMKAELTTNGQWDEENKIVKFTVEAEVDRKLRQSRDSDLAEARKTAAPGIRAAVAQWIDKITGVGAELAAKAAPKMNSGEETLSRGKYTVQVAIALDDMVSAAYKAKAKAEEAAKAAEKPAEKPAEKKEGAEGAPAEDAPKEAGTNAGAGGTTGGDAPKE